MIHRLGYFFAAFVVALAFCGCSGSGLFASHGDFAGEEEESEGREGPVNPDRAFQWRRLAWLDEHGDLAPDAYRNALAQRRANLDASSREGPGGIAPARWVERGPGNVAGRQRALLIDPADPNRMWSGAVGGGLWFSADAGATWSVVNDNFETLAVGCLTMDPLDRNTIYVGTGEGFFNGDALGGVGIYRSTDGGITWVLLPATAGFGSVNRIAVCPLNTNVLLAATSGGLRRSADGGASWTVVRSAQSCLDVKFAPGSGNAVAHVADRNGSQWAHSVIYSVNRGATWNTASGAAGFIGFSSRIELAYALSDPDIVYASTGRNGGEIWRSEDGGQSFFLRTQADQSTSTSWYANPLWVSPTDPEVLLTGGGHILRSIDGGRTFTQISSGYILTQQPHPDIHNFTTHPGFNGTTNRRVYVVTDGGAFLAQDVLAASTSSGWSFIGLGCRTSQFYAAVGHGPTDKVVGGTQDNGTLRVIGDSTTANLTFGGDGGWCAIDPVNPSYVFGEYINLKIHRSTDGGQSASYIYGGLTDAENGDANFIAPFILDPDTRHILAGGRSLWRCANPRSQISVQWSAIKGDSGANISAIAVAPGDGDIIWVGHNDGKVFRTSNGTNANPTWIAVDDNAGANPLPNRYIARIVIDSTNHNRAFIALGGFSPDNIQRTTDNGLTFTDITGAGASGLPDAPVRGLAQHPAHADWLYAGTEVGVFATDDGGATWSTSNLGPTTASVDELNFMSGSTVLLAATHGRGMWTTATDVCAADISGSTDPNSPQYGQPDGLVDSADFFFFLDRFVAGDLGAADLSSTSDPNAAGYGVPDGAIDSADFFYFLDIFVEGCA